MRFDLTDLRLFCDVVDDGAKLASPRVAVTCDPGTIADGFRCDVDGNLWVGAGPGEDLDGVKVYNPDGKPIGHIALPERCANLTFGGPKNNRLYMTSSHSVYAYYVEAHGAV